jgi:hypothetical protein
MCLCCAVGSSEKEKMKKIAFSRTRNKKDKRKWSIFLRRVTCALKGIVGKGSIFFGAAFQGF